MEERFLEHGSIAEATEEVVKSKKFEKMQVEEDLISPARQTAQELVDLALNRVLTEEVPLMKEFEFEAEKEEEKSSGRLIIGIGDEEEEGQISPRPTPERNGSAEDWEVVEEQQEPIMATTHIITKLGKATTAKKGHEPSVYNQPPILDTEVLRHELSDIVEIERKSAEEDSEQECIAAGKFRVEEEYQEEVEQRIFEQQTAAKSPEDMDVDVESDEEEEEEPELAQLQYSQQVRILFYYTKIITNK